jgi:hypothetical protein
MKWLSSLRLPIMAIVMLGLLAAIWAGLIRLGWNVPALQPALPAVHGPLMIGGFLGTLIALERAVALGKGWAYAAPAFGALGVIALIFGLPAGLWLVTLSSLGLVAIFVLILGRHLTLYTATMALGAVAWLAGNGLWLWGRPVPMVVPWWVAFLLLTIAGERLELSRITRLSSYSQILFAGIVALILSGLLLSLFVFVLGLRLENLGFVALALWLGWYDISRRTVRRPGITRFIALNLLLGYFWLGVGGLLGLRFAGLLAGPAYDAWLHALLLGFVFSMIFAHALIILPVVARITLPFSPILYGPVVLMQFGLLIRIVGDLALWWPARLWGGLLNGLAIVWFFLIVAGLAFRERRRYISQPANGLEKQGVPSSDRR